MNIKLLKKLFVLIFCFVSSIHAQSIFKDCTAGKGNGDVNYLGENSKGFFFSSRDNNLTSSLWFSDGTANGTTLLKQFQIKDYFITQFATVENDKLLFTLSAQISPLIKLWISDGTDSGTYQLGDVDYISFQDLKGSVKWLKNRYCFLWNAEGIGPSIWVSDGTENNFEFVKDIDTNSKAIQILPQLRILNDKLYFFAYHTDFGNELWTTDGTDTGTHIEIDLLPGLASGINNYNQLNIFKNQLCYNGRIANIDNYQLFTYNTTSKGITKFFSDDSILNNFSAVSYGLLGDSMLFINCLHNGKYEVWISDGNASGTRTIHQKQVSTSHEYLGAAFQLGSMYVLYYYTDLLGYEMWSFDMGTMEVKLLKDINPGINTSLVTNNFVKKNNRLFFIASSPAFGNDIWATDGTDEGTILYEDINNNGYYVNRIVVFKNQFFLIGLLDSAYGAEIYNFEQLNTKVRVPEVSGKVSVYPNPCSSGDILRIEASEQFQEVMLYDINGRCHSVQIQNNQVTLPENLAAGIYTLIFKEADGYINQIKLIIL